MPEKFAKLETRIGQGRREFVEFEKASIRNTEEFKERFNKDEEETQTIKDRLEFNENLVK